MPDAGGLELAQAIVALTDAAVAWMAYGIAYDSPVAPPAAQAKVAAAMVRVADHLGPAAGAARIVIPAPAIDAGALLIWSAVAWGGPLLLALQRWRDSRVEDRQADNSDRSPGGADRIGGRGANPGRPAGPAQAGRSGAQAGPDGPGFDAADYGARLAASVARPGGTVPRID